jgi:serine protease
MMLRPYGPTAMVSHPPFRALAITALVIGAVGTLVRAPSVSAAGPVSASAPAARYVPREVLVGYSTGATSSVAQLARKMGAGAPGPSASPGEALLRLPAGTSVASAIASLRRDPGVAYAVPDYIAHVAGTFFPNDRGRTFRPRGWEAVQWNFLAAAGVDAPEAWANLIGDHHAGGRGVTVAILDTGVAYRAWRRYRRSPDFAGTRFAAPYDFISHNRFPLDREGHGTFIAGTVAEATNNRLALTGLAYGATIMPVRVLDQKGEGDAMTIARGIDYAVNHGAQVINLSLEFDLSVTASSIPGVLRAIAYAHRHGVVVVAAAGNDGVMQLAYPARDPDVVSVGATTRDRCLADYSDVGPGLDLVAPGGGEDSPALGAPNCQPGRRLPDISQMTFLGAAHPDRFTLPTGWYGTSMAAAHVAAAAALVIASGVLGSHPTPDQILARLEQTAHPLSARSPSEYYGSGLIDTGAATSAAIPPSGAGPT